MPIRDRIGFVLHSAELYNHYRNVVLRLDRDRVELVLLASITDSRQRLESRLTQDGVPYVDVDEVSRRRWRYRFLVTNHIMGGADTWPYLPERIGLYNIRFMYALGKARHNFSAWNEIYNVILCHGPYQVERLAFCADALLLQMGYPRYDRFEEEWARRDVIRERLGVGRQRAVVLWMPTWRGLSSLDHYIPAVAGLTGEFDVIVKLHPGTVSSEPARLERVRASGLQLITDEMLDITELYAAADCVLADYGGSIFSAIYVDRPIVLLDAEARAVESDPLTGRDSPDVLVRSSLPHLELHQADRLAEKIRQAMQDETGRQSRDALRARYFAPYRGRASEVAANYLRNLEQLLAGRRPGRLRRSARARLRGIARGEVPFGSVVSSVSNRLTRQIRRWTRVRVDQSIRYDD